MYAENVDRGRVSLGRALNGLLRVVLIGQPRDSGRENVVFMNIGAETGGRVHDAAAVMTASCAHYLVSGFERIKTGDDGPMTIANEAVAWELRFFYARFAESALRSDKRACIPPQVREHAGIPLDGRVFVAKRNGYAVISPSRAIAEIAEAAPWDGRVTTIDIIVAEIVANDKAEREAAVSCRYQ